MKFKTSMRYIFIFIGLLLPAFVFAQEYFLLSDLGSFDRVNTDDPDAYVQLLFRIFITVAAVLGVIRLMICGIQYMLSESISTKGAARTCLTYVIGGLLLILISWLLLNTINSDITDSDLNFIETRINSGSNGGAAPPDPGGGACGFEPGSQYTCD